jgi:hypothetical protein
VLFLVHRFLSPWWRRRQVPLKRRFLQKPHGVTTQKTPFFKLVLLRSVCPLLVAACIVPSSPILVTLMKEAPGSSETSVLTRATRCNIPEDTILHCFHHNFTGATKYVHNSYESDLFCQVSIQNRNPTFQDVSVSIIRDARTKFLYVYFSFAPHMKSGPDDEDSFQCYISILYWCF